ncbi:hypothetical protein B0H19DRAFT_921394, partial [Mycena capillaripes]
LPPGLLRDPVIGHLRYMLSKNRANVFHEWFKTYDLFVSYNSKCDVIYLDGFGKPMIFLSTKQVAVDLLNKRSAIYSDRPRFILYVMQVSSSAL